MPISEEIIRNSRTASTLLVTDALDLNGRLGKRNSHGLFNHLAVSRQLELEHGAFRYVR